MATVLVIGDTHCPAMRDGYIRFLQRIADKYSVNRVVHIGDLADWSSISFHQRSPRMSNPSREFAEAHRQIHRLAEAFPKADWMIGNHDALTVRQAEEVGLPAEALKSYSELWELKWKVHERFSTIEIDGVLYSHGEVGRGGQDAAFNQCRDQFQSVVIGHFHSNAGVKYWVNHSDRVFGLSVGCGIDADKLAFEYGRKFTRKPVLGCGVVIGGNVAIFEPWLLPCKR